MEREGLHIHIFFANLRAIESVRLICGDPIDSTVDFSDGTIRGS
jgi:hypothetical protein